MGSFVQFLCFLFKLWSFNCLKKMHFWHSCADLSEKSKSVKAICIYASKRSRYALSEIGNCLLCYSLLFWRHQSLNSKKFVKFLLSQHPFLYFNCQHFMNGGSDPYKPYHFLKECNENFQMQFVNCFNRLRFLAEVNTKLQKMHLFRQLKDHNLGKKHGNQTNDPIS